MEVVTNALSVEQLLSDAGAMTLRVTGCSMQPLLINNRDSVLLKKYDGEEIKRGTIVLFKRENGSLVLHRAVKCSGNRLKINGDAQNWIEFISRNQVLGTVQLIIRNNKEISLDSFPYKVYCFLWQFTRHIRPAFHKIYAVLKRG